MKLKLFLMLAVVSSGLMAADVRLNNNGVTGHHGIINRNIQISKATYGTARGHCDFTNRLARVADDKTTYLFKSGNQWCGDPSGGNKKMATIEYTCHGKTKRALVKEGHSEFLRCN